MYLLALLPATQSGGHKAFFITTFSALTLNYK